MQQYHKIKESNKSEQRKIKMENKQSIYIAMVVEAMSLKRRKKISSHKERSCESERRRQHMK
jgi:hypothetical protein